jgi:hypothetical protein
MEHIKFSRSGFNPLKTTAESRLLSNRQSVHLSIQTRYGSGPLSVTIVATIALDRPL